MSLLPPDDDLELLHTRNYEVRVYYVSVDELLVRGAISDLKPGELYLADDPEPLEIHQMQVEWRVSLPGLEILEAKVGFETHPNESCPSIATHYENLAGLVITRGFTHKVRELFGGPRGCSHATALLQAMAPAAVQSLWSVSVRQARESGVPAGVTSDDGWMRRFAANINTCHIWDEGGEVVAELRAGVRPPPPLPIRERLAQLGRNPEEWGRGA